MDTGFQDDGPFAMLPQMMPWDMGPTGEMPELRHLHLMHLQSPNLDEKQKKHGKKLKTVS